MIQQGTKEWFDVRRGKITASRVKDVVAVLKSGGESASRADYKMQLALERMTGQTAESFCSKDMIWGTETEPLARLAYCVHTGLDVDEVGFIDHPDVLRSGASPDGLVGDSGLVEIKCPKTTTLVEWAVDGKVPTSHLDQMQWQMECSGREWGDFVAYDPRMPSGSQLFIRRLPRDEARLIFLRNEVSVFDQEVEELIEKIRKARWF